MQDHPLPEMLRLSLQDLVSSVSLRDSSALLEADRMNDPLISVLADQDP
jgi:hypothetical protein